MNEECCIYHIIMDQGQIALLHIPVSLSLVVEKYSRVAYIGQPIISKQKYQFLYRYYNIIDTIL